MCCDGTVLTFYRTPILFVILKDLPSLEHSHAHVYRNLNGRLSLLIFKMLLIAKQITTRKNNSFFSLLTTRGSTGSIGNQ